jgi:hypothetical protein
MLISSPITSKELTLSFVFVMRLDSLIWTEPLGRVSLARPAFNRGPGLVMIFYIIVCYSTTNVGFAGGMRFPQNVCSMGDQVDHDLQ